MDDRADNRVVQSRLTQDSPIDEFGYTVPAFNLHHYGTWVHQAAPWAPVDVQGSRQGEAGRA